MILTVIITAYNAEKYIKECINSILNNTPDELLKETEIIVTDDASEDSTADIVRSFGERVRLIHLDKNCGCVAQTRNIGLIAAKGEYITYLDSDDRYEKDAVSKIFECIKKYKPDIIKYGYTEVYPNGETKIPNINPAEFELIRKEDFKTKIYPLFINGIALNSVCLAVFRRNILKNIQFPKNFRTAEDAAFSIQVYTAAGSVLMIPDRLYRYYQSGTGLTGKGMGLFKKYKYNFMLVPIMIKSLPKWGLDSIGWRIKTVMRPIALTLDKLRRMK